VTIDSFSGEHAFLSNFYPCVVHVAGFACASVEHGFQASKAVKQDDFHLIMGARTPGISKKLGRKVERRFDWEQVKEGVMYHLLKEKFQFNPLKNALLATGEHTLIEGNTWGDTYWGVCKGVGKNRLGVLLMQVREELRDV
jgi:N-glycosidase YbiA